MDTHDLCKTLYVHVFNEIYGQFEYWYYWQTGVQTGT